MASYTGVLIAATAIPLWYTGRRHIPAIFACSAMTSGAALQSLLLALFGGSPRTAKKLETVELAASLAEAALLLAYERHAGELGKPLFTGKTGSKLKTWTLGLGIALPALVNLPSVLSRKPPTKHHRLRTILTARSRWPAATSCARLSSRPAATAPTTRAPTCATPNSVGQQVPG